MIQDDKTQVPRALSGIPGVVDRDKPRILLVDDQPARLLTYESILEGVGVQCVRALSGQEALTRLLQERFAVILLDVSMPGMDGFETAQFIRQHPRYVQTPIIFVTGVHVTALDTLKGYGVGAIDYISVPVVPEILRSKVALLAELYGRRTQLEALNQELAAARDRLEAEHNKAMAAAEARREREWLAAVLDSISDEVYFTDTHGRYTYANPAALEQFGHDAVQGTQVGDLATKLEVLRPDGSPRPIEEAPPLRALKGESIRNEEQIVRIPATGELRHRQVSSAPVRDTRGKIIGAVSVARDITENRIHEQQLREADRRKNEFLAMLSHELRNPLAPIRNVVGFLNLPDLPTERLNWARGMLHRQVTHMSRLLDDLLDVTRGTGGQLTIDKQPISIKDVVEAALDPPQLLIEKKAQRLVVDLPSDIPMLNADLVRLAQVVANLLTNSAKYTDRGGLIQLSVRAEGSTLHLSVRDNGIGIAPDQIPQLFTMFSQLDSARDRSEGGLGIGLALAKSIVELHGGTIEAKSAGVGTGSEFQIRLPLLDSAAASDAFTSQARSTP